MEMKFNYMNIQGINQKLIMTSKEKIGNKMSGEITVEKLLTRLKTTSTHERNKKVDKYSELCLEQG